MSERNLRPRNQSPPPPDRGRQPRNIWLAPRATSTPTTPTGFFPHVSTVTPDDIAHANRPSTQMLLSMAILGKPIYEGTVSAVEVQRRRIKNRAARRARALHRRRAR